MTSQCNNPENSSHAFKWYGFAVIMGAIFVMGLLNTHTAFAQEVDQDSIEHIETVESEMVNDESEAESVDDSEPSSEVQADEKIDVEDIGLQKARILPNNPFHAFKRLGRNFREAITFNPVKKAQLRLDNANKELAEAKQLLDEETVDEKTTKHAQKALERYQKRINKISANIDKIKEKRADGDENVDALLDDVLDKHIKHQKILEHAERKILEHAPEEVRDQVLQRIKTAQTRFAEHAGQFVGGIDSPEQLERRVSRVLEAQKGSDFKDFKNTAIMRHLEEFAPDNVKEAFEKAQKQRLQEMAHNFKNRSGEGLENDFEKYMQHVGGDEIRHMEILDRMGHMDVPEEFRHKFDRFKDIHADRFQEKMEHFEELFGEKSAEIYKNQQFDNLRKSDVERMRVMRELRDRIKFENEEIERKMEQVEKQQVQQFTQTFTDEQSQNQVERFKQLSKKMRENPDPTTFRLLQALEEEVKSDPKKREFIERMERETKSEFARRAQTEGDNFLKHISSGNPKDMEVFERLHQDFTEHGDEFDHEFQPDEFNQFFDRARHEHEERIIDQLREIDDPHLLEKFNRKFEGVNEDAIRRLKQNGEFNQLLNERRELRRDDVGNNLHDEEQRRIQEERDRLQREFDEKLNQIEDEGQRNALMQQRIEQERRLKDREIEAKNRHFEARIQVDPLCDEQCQQFERQQWERHAQDSRKRFEDEVRNRPHIDGAQDDHEFEHELSEEEKRKFREFDSRQPRPDQFNDRRPDERPQGGEFNDRRPDEKPRFDGDARRPDFESFPRGPEDRPHDNHDENRPEFRHQDDGRFDGPSPEALRDRRSRDERFDALHKPDPSTFRTPIPFEPDFSKPDPRGDFRDRPSENFRPDDQPRSDSRNDQTRPDGISIEPFPSPGPRD